MASNVRKKYNHGDHGDHGDFGSVRVIAQSKPVLCAARRQGEIHRRDRRDRCGSKNFGADMLTHDNLVNDMVSSARMFTALPQDIT